MLHSFIHFPKPFLVWNVILTLSLIFSTPLISFFHDAGWNVCNKYSKKCFLLMFTISLIGGQKILTLPLWYTTSCGSSSMFPSSSSCKCIHNNIISLNECKYFLAFHVKSPYIFIIVNNVSRMDFFQQVFTVKKFCVF